MRNIFSHPEKSIAAKLIIATGLLIVIMSLIFWYATLKKQEKDIMSIAVNYGNSFADFTKQSTRHSMLNNEREETQRVLTTLSAPEGVLRVRIYDHSGEILFCSHEQSVGTLIDKDSVACTGCHSDPEDFTALLRDQKRWAMYKNESGDSSLKVVSPITNEPDCYTGSCHAHPKDQEILGFVEADLSMTLLDQALFKQSLALTAYVIIFVLAVSLFLGIINFKIVTHPVHQLTNAMEHVAEGDLEYSVPIKSEDEIGVLAKAFNSMTKDLKAARDQESSGHKHSKQK
jgi:two-component system NtrC family sensor kinase